MKRSVCEAPIKNTKIWKIKNGIVSGIILLLVLGTPRVKAQSYEIQQLLLDVEKLSQLKSILADLKKGYEIVSNGYTAIKSISEINFHLHDLFLDRLLQVSPVVKNYRKVGAIISTQLNIVREYKTALQQFKASDLFNSGEIDYISKVYANLFDQSVKNLEDLAMVLTAGKLRMSDDERLTTIDTLWENMEDSFVFLRRFNNETKVLALQRAKEKADVSTVKKLYSINK